MHNINRGDLLPRLIKPLVKESVRTYDFYVDFAKLPDSLTFFRGYSGRSALFYIPMGFWPVPEQKSDNPLLLHYQPLVRHPDTEFVVIFDDFSVILMKGQIGRAPRFPGLRDEAPDKAREVEDAIRTFTLTIKRKPQLGEFCFWFNQNTIRRLAARHYQSHLLDKLDFSEAMTTQEKIESLLAAKSLLDTEIARLREPDAISSREFLQDVKERYASRESRLETPWQFLFRVYGRYDNRRKSALEHLTQALLRTVDLPLYRALHGWCERNMVEPDSILPRTRTSIRKKHLPSSTRSKSISFDDWIIERREKHPDRRKHDPDYGVQYAKSNRLPDDQYFWDVLQGKGTTRKYESYLPPELRDEKK